MTTLVLTMGSTQELLARIRELEIENMGLKSKLDQYKSIFNVDGGLPGVSSGPPSGPGGHAQPRARRVNRAMGISAEPQSLKTMKDLIGKTFQEFKKNDK